MTQKIDKKKVEDNREKSTKGERMREKRKKQKKERQECMKQ